MIGPRDYLVIGFYLAFMLALGLVFRGRTRNTSDYFRGGGAMLWWMGGASAMMSALSAWSFTGAAGAIYESGLLIGVIYGANIAGLLVVYWFSGERFRRLRVVTYAEAIRRRYGAATEQFYVWFQVPVAILVAGMQLNAVGVFMAAVFQTPVIPTVLTLAGVVIFMAMIGGAWAVVAGDFLQLTLTLLVLGLASWFALRLPEVGGLAGLLEKPPAQHFDWSRLMRPEIATVWIVALALNQVCEFNNLAGGAARFLMVKDGEHARKAALAMIGCFALLLVVLFIPPMAAAVALPNLAAQFPQLDKPQEAAFVAICLKAMPSGLLGLLVVGIFAAAMASMDTGLNRNAGVIVRNFYGRVLRPRADERELMIAAKACTLGCGLAVTGIACAFSALRTLDLFDLSLTIGSLLAFPLMLPMVLGFFVRGAPPWAGWSTALVGGAVAAAVRYGELAPAAGRALGWTLNPREVLNLGYAGTVLGTLFVGGAWYAWSVWRARRTPEPEHVREFFADLARPVVAAEEHAPGSDALQYRTMSRLCLIYGAGLAAFALFAGDLAGRMSFLFCSAVILALGGLIAARGRRERARETDRGA